MNVLLITGDSEIMRDGSPAQAALLQEAAQVNKLMVIIMNSRHRHGYARKVNDHLWLFPMNAWTPFDNFFRALGVIRKEIFFRNRLQFWKACGQTVFGERVRIIIVVSMQLTRITGARFYVLR